MFDIAVYESFTDLPSDVRVQTRYPSQGNFFLSLDWFSIIYDTVLSNTHEARVFVAREKDGAVAGVLFCKAQPRARSLASMTCFYSIEYGLTTCGRERICGEVIRAIVEFIANQRPRWHVFELRYLKGDCPYSSVFAESLCRSGFSPQRFFQYENWRYADNGADFGTYYSVRPSRLKNTIKRKMKQCMSQFDVEFKIYDKNDDELQTGLADYVAIYNKSWKQPEPFSGFIPELARQCAELGVLQLGVLYLDHKPVASQIWLEMGQRSVIYKLAYDEGFKQFSVGSILSREMFERAFERGSADEIDYGVGSESYKKDWMQNAGDIVGLQALNKKTPYGTCRILGRGLATAFSRGRSQLVSATRRRVDR